MKYSPTTAPRRPRLFHLLAGLLLVAGCGDVLGPGSLDAELRIAPIVPGDPVAIAIDEAGRVMGQVNGRDFLWDPAAGDTTLLPYVGANAVVRGLNGQGMVVGVERTDWGTTWPFRWTEAGGGGRLPLPIGWDWQQARVTGLNDAGVIVGWGETFGQPSGPFPLVWLTDGSVFTTSSAPDSLARFEATAVGPSGAVWGSIERADSRPVVRWTGSGVEVIGHPEGFAYTTVLDTDDQGRVLLRAETADTENPTAATFVYDGAAFQETAIFAQTMGPDGELVGCERADRCTTVVTWTPEQGRRSFSFSNYFADVTATVAVDVNAGGDVVAAVVFAGGQHRAVVRLRPR